MLKPSGRSTGLRLSNEGKDVLLQQMNKMQPTLINLQEIIYRIQIRNFNTTKLLI